MRRKLVVGNWKMYGNLAWNKALLDAAVEGLRDYRNADYAICVPHPYLWQAQAILQGTNIAWGGQNMNQFEGGAFTGSVAPHMLVDFGCSYVIIGHSERRELCNESDPVVAAKFEAAVKVGMKPVFCIGESREEHEAGEAEEVVARQLDAVLTRVGAEGLAKGVLAYEPVWAIGTGRGASPHKAQSVHAFIRKRIASLDSGVAASIRILHGGSVRVANAAQLLSMPDIDGALVGNASLVADQFIAICRAAN
ncbi:MAG TPA: triose-phosphate isomerase [Novimethylophilus sp.]|jgi:triosephosphate isomerase|uniref:triose-phosphate isomerase n=1 Tax=Novimethylophilus sp. TaxID=2137426 RepID=UPI002F429CF9